jgi:hypothetical protein
MYLASRQQFRLRLASLFRRGHRIGVCLLFGGGGLLRATNRLGLGSVRVMCG